MYIDSPNISGSLNITGSILLNGTAVTASGGGGGSGAGFPFSGSAVITGSLFVSGGNLSGSFAGDGAGLTGVTINQFATVNDTFTNVPSHSVVHNFGTKDVFVQVFESDDTLLIPQTVTTTNTNQVDIVFGDVLSGRVVIGRAGHILQDTGNFVSSSTTVATFSNAMSASISHNFDSLNIITQVYDSNNNVIVPSNIKNTNSNQTLITFSTPRSGKAVIAKAGHIVSGTAAVSASFATTAERVRAGSSGSRDTSTPESGSLWYNTNTGKLEVYNGISGIGWDAVTTTGLPPYNIEYLVIAGGGGGAAGRDGDGCTGGGGAGGYLSSSLADVSTGVVLTATIGAGGDGGPATGIADGSDGTNTTLEGSGIATVTAIGGGAGDSQDGNNANSGGSGGGGAGGGNPVSAAGGDGTVGQGNAGGDAYNPGGSGATKYAGGGGGGAGAAGGTGLSNGTSGAGGDGLASNISGTSVTRAGGGGAGDNRYGGSSSAGGAGGGGAGGSSNTNGTAGTANTGGGGGAGSGNSGGNSSYAGGNGGSGVVILRMQTSNYSGTTTGSPTVTTSGTDTIITFTSSGTYTS